MQKSISEEHPELFHYTNAAGLAGIIQSQTLWATHYAYLNDSDEIRHFLEKKFPDILQPIIYSYLNELVELVQKNPAQQFIKIENRKINIEQEGGINEIANRLTRETTTKLINIILGNSDDKGLAEPYVTSFCSTNENSQVNDHGLLSQ